MPQFHFSPNLIIKGDNENQAKQALVKRLNEWFNEAPTTASFSPGTLLLWNFSNDNGVDAQAQDPERWDGQS